MVQQQPSYPRADGSHADDRNVGFFHPVPAVFFRLSCLFFACSNGFVQDLAATFILKPQNGGVGSSRFSRNPFSPRVCREYPKALEFEGQNRFSGPKKRGG